MNIIVSVVNQQLKVATDLNNFVAGSQNFIRFLFDLPSDWDGLITFAQFTQNGTSYNVYLDSEEHGAYLPPEIEEGTCTVMLYGVGNDVKATTNLLTIKIKPNWLDRSGIDIEERAVSQEWYEQLIERIKNVIDMEDVEVQEIIERTAGEIMQEYMQTDEFIQRTIAIQDNSITSVKFANGAIVRQKVDSDLEATLQLADSSMQPDVYDPTGKETDIFAYADAGDVTTIAKIRSNASDAEVFTVNDGTTSTNYTGLNNALNGLLVRAESFATDAVNNSTLVVNELPQTGDTSKNYIVYVDGAYMMYRYINNNWELIAGGNAEIIITEYDVDYSEIGTPADNGYVASATFEDQIYLDLSTLITYTVTSEEDQETGDISYSWEINESLVTTPSEYSDYFVKFGSSTNLINFRYMDGEFMQVGKSASTLVVNELPDIGNSEVDYILSSNGEYKYYKYINGNWAMIAGGSAEIITRNFAVDYYEKGDPSVNNYIPGANYVAKYYFDLESLAIYQVAEDVEDSSYSWVRTDLVAYPSENKDYYVGFNGEDLLHFRYVGTSFQQIGTISYTKDDINSMISGLRTNISANSNRITANESSIQQLNNAMTSIQQTISSIDTEGYQYYATYGTVEINGEETPNVYRLIETKDGSEEVVSQFVIQGGGGGGSASSTTLTVERVTSSPLVVTPTDRVLLVYNFSSVDADQEEIDGTFTWKMGSTVIATGTCVQGQNTFDATDYCTIGTQKFTLNIADEGGSTAVKTWTVQKVDVRLESSFNDRTTYVANQPVSFTYTPYGSIQKTIHFKLDGVELEPVTTNASGILQSVNLPGQSHGAHLLECWGTAVINSSSIETPHIFKDIIWYDEGSTIPVIGCINRCVPVAADAVYDEDTLYYYMDENDLFVPYEYSEASWSDENRPQLYYRSVVANQYDSTAIDYVVYDPTSGLPLIIQTIDGISQSLSMTTYYDTINYKTSDSGVHTINIACGATEVNIIMDIQELDINVEPVIANLAFDFNPIGMSNLSENRMWKYSGNENIALSVSDNFDWSNGGYQVDSDGTQYFCVKAGTRASFSYNLFGTSPYTTGSHFKLIFKTTNVSDINTTWMTCYADSVGLIMKAHQADLITSAKTLEAPYSEEDVIEFDYNIETLDTENENASSLIMIYEDGVAYRPLIYDSTHRIHQYNPVGITFGSDNCDVHIYRMKAYTALLTDSDTISNFIADATNSEQMIARYNRNQIYNDNNVLTAESLAAACPNLKVIKIDCPKFTNNKSETILDTTIQCIHSGGDPILDNWTARNCGHSGQGTTSNEYGISGRNLDLKMNQDNTVLVLGDGTTFNDGTGKITLTRGSVPTNYTNVKVNIASSENANNALLAKRYDRYLPYTTPAKRKNSKVKNTMEFVNCAIFVRENDSDLSTHREFNDTEWHFYGIGNIGDSKKTDKTRVHDPNDQKEFVNEILDNTLPNSIFDTGVYNMIVESLPTVGDLFTDYYIQDGNGFILNRYLNSSWVTDITTVDEIQNGAVALVTALPASGIINVEYYIEDSGVYTMYTWDGTAWSEGTVRESITNSHMANSIDPAQWVAGNGKYDSLHVIGEEKFGSNTFEMRYEPKGITAEQHAANLQVWFDLYEWIITSTDENFVNHFEDWFIKDSLTYYYVFTERYTMIDNRSKNSFWHWGKFYISEEEAAGDYADVADYYIIDNNAAAIHDGYRFDMWGYDFDSSIGINNSGELKMPYGKEDIDFYEDDVPASGYIFNGAQSVIFRRMRLLMHNDLRAMYQDRESAGAWTSSTMIQEFDNWQAEWPEELWRLDIQRKYERPYLGTAVDNSIPKSSTRFLSTMMNGRKKYHRRQYERDQSVYMDTKYLASAIRDDQIMFRCNTPQSAVVSPDYTLQIVPYSDMYLSVMFGNTTPYQIRAKAGNTYRVECPLTTMDDTAILIYAASRIQALNDLSACYIHDNDFSKATRLQTLVIGNTTQGYTNTFLTTLTIGNNTLLKSLDLRNCPNLTGSLNLSRCGSLLSLRAEGTAITGVIFATNGKLNTVYLPDTVTSLTMRNLDYLDSVHNNLDNLESLVLENGIMDSLAMIQSTADTLQSLRLIGINWTLPSSEILNAMYNMSQSFVSGSVYVNGPIRVRELQMYADKWENLEVTYNPSYIVDQYQVTYVNDDGTQLFQTYIDRGSAPIDPVALGLIPTPTKVSTDQYNYTYAGWDDITSVVLAARTITAVYSETVRTYTVTWYSRSGVPITSTQAQYGSEVVYSGEIPTRTDEESSYVFNVFTGWDKSTGYITGDTDVYAVWDRKGLPVGKQLNSMSVAEIYGLGNASSANVSDYLEEKDYIDIPIGNDFDFINVESDVLANEQWFDGTNQIDTGIKLLNSSADSFTLAVDFEFYGTTNNATLVSCYEENGNEGFRLRYNTNPNIQWGDKTCQVGSATRHGLCVIRHIKGSDKLYVYAFNITDSTLSSDIVTYELTRSRSTTTETTLIFGAVKVLADGGYVNNAKGWIHWAKIWYQDLGDANCRELAAWTHETWRAEFVGSENRYRIPNTSRYAKVSFILNNLLLYGAPISSSGKNTGGWPASEMRTLLNNRIYKALPISWRAILKTVRINSSAGGTSSEIVYSDDKIYIPSVSEISTTYTEPYNSEGQIIPWFTRDAARAKFRGISVPTSSYIYSSSEDPTSNSSNTVNAGDLWYYSQSYYVYIPQEQASKHIYPSIGGSNITAANGGLWYHASEWWTRSPSVDYEAYNLYVSYSGYPNFPNMTSTSYGIDVCFSV